MIEIWDEIGAAAPDEEIEDLCEVVRETCAAIHLYLRHGHLGRVYENALAHRLRRQALAVAQQTPLSVYDEDGVHLGSLVADLLVEGLLLIRVKTCPALRPEHEIEAIGQLAAARLVHGLVVNFGAPAFEARRVFRAETR